MNILKLYDRAITAKFAMKAFADTNPGCVVRKKDMKVVLYNGTVVIFGYIGSGYDYHKYRGFEIQCLDVIGDISEEAVNFMKTRIRG